MAPLWNDYDCSHGSGEEFYAVCERPATNLYTITRRFQMTSNISGGTALMITDHCLVQQPHLQAKGIKTKSLIRCAVSCADDSECKAFNFFRSADNSKPVPSNSSTTRELKAICQKLMFTTKDITEGFAMTPIDGCNYYELECRK